MSGTHARRAPWLVLVALVPILGCPQGGPRPGRPGVFGPGVAPLRPGEPVGQAAGGTLYVPIYSHIYTSRNADPINLAATLSVRNPGPAAPLVLTRVTYHGSDGRAVRDYLEAPVRVAPLAAAEFFVAENDTAGGSGASFLVEWRADRPPGPAGPIVEAVHVNTASSQGLVFTTHGVPIATLGPPAPAAPPGAPAGQP